MNYRHAYHAGNFADCMKHALLVSVVRALQRKPKPLFVLDTHAGRGRYDLCHGAAARTAEWRAGIGRLLADPPAALAEYVGLVCALGLYPGSPALIQGLLRPCDRLACCELHPEEAAALRRQVATDARVAVHCRDGFAAVGALLPPAERRGVVLVDPPYEAPGEFERLAEALARGYRRFRNGVFAGWYPIKHRAPVRAMHAAMRESGVRDVVAAELLLREPTDPARLNGCGLLVVNPPFGFAAEAAAILDALRKRLGEGAPGEGGGLTRLVDE